MSTTCQPVPHRWRRWPTNRRWILSRLRLPYRVSMRFHVLTLFPEAFGQPSQFSMVARASRNGLISIEVTDIRDYSQDAHGTADDYQFGGGHGMVMKPEPVFRATEATLSSYTASEKAQVPVALFTPQGELLTQRVVEETGASARHRADMRPLCRSRRAGLRRVGHSAKSASATTY